MNYDIFENGLLTNQKQKRTISCVAIILHIIWCLHWFVHFASQIRCQWCFGRFSFKMSFVALSIGSIFFYRMTKLSYIVASLWNLPISLNNTRNGWSIHLDITRIIKTNELKKKKNQHLNYQQETIITHDVWGLFVHRTRLPCSEWMCACIGECVFSV